MGLGLGLGVDSLHWGMRSNPYLLDAFPNAVAAYSLRKLSMDYTGMCMGVRRSSDEQSQDIGFVDGDIDVASLLGFVNQSVTRYASDFSVNNDGWVGVGGSAVGNVDGIFGEDDVLEYTIDANTTSHFTYVPALDANPQEYNVRLKVFIPSTNTQVDRVRVSLGASGTDIQVIIALDEWVVVDITDIPAGNNRINVFAQDSGSTNYTGNGTDKIYIKDVIAEQRTADGHVYIWFDQAQVGSYALQTFTALQPYIVKSGNYLGYVENTTSSSGNPLVSTYAYSNGTNYSSFFVVENFGDAVFGGTSNGGVFYAVAQANTQTAQAAGILNPEYFDNGVSIGDKRQDILLATNSFSVLTSRFQYSNSANSMLLGYTSSAYNKVRIKEYVVYDNQSVDRIKVEKNIIKYFAL